MARHGEIHAFLNSAAWRKLRLQIIADRKNTCQKCGRIIFKAIEIIAHHKKELTPENIGDYNVSMNPDNIKLVCFDCHNAEHRRYNHKPVKQVFIIYGPPLSGKTTYVNQNMQNGDIVVCMDRIYHALTGMPITEKPESLLPVVMGLYRQLIDNVRTRYGGWLTAWVITGGAERHKRERLSKETGGELIFCDVSREECLKRLEVDEERKHYKQEWLQYIDKWFDRYS